LNIELKDIQKSIAETILPHDQKKKSEEKIEKLLLAIKSIYQDNDWILWDREINDDDKVKSTNFDIHGMSLEGLSLSSLRKLIEQEKWNLFQIYKVTWETEAKQKLLKEEINLFAGVWGLYEWGARYFSLSESEINRKVSGLLSTMSNTSEIFEYIKKINKDIRKNRKKSDMVTQVNGKLIQSLYRKTYERLKNENAPNKDFIECCKIMTWRWKSSGEKNGFAYENLTMEESFKDYQLGNEIIIHLMMKKWWVFDNMKKEFSVQDPEVEKNESPSAIISHSMSVLNNLGQKMPTTKTAQELLKDMHIPNVSKIQWKYSELNFNEKVDLWALVRIVNTIESMWYEDTVNNPEKFQKKFQNASQDAFKDLNKALSNHFDGANVDLSMWKDWLSWFNMNIWWMEASDLWLSWEFGEVFNLYQDMNGNSWFFDWSDQTKDFLSPSLAWMATITASFIIFWVAVALAPVSVPGIILAGAGAGAATWFTTSILSSQWFDTKSEALTNTAATMAADAALWGVFFWLWNKYVIKKWFASLKDVPFWTTTNGKEMLRYGGGEMLANIYLVAPIMWAISKNIFDKNHFDTENYKYKNWKQIPRYHEIQNMETQEIKKEVKTYKVFHEGEFFQEVETEWAPLASALTDENEIQETKESFIDSDILPLINFKEKLETKPFSFAKLKADTETVKSLQLFLSKNGGNPLEVDGMFGQITYEAVKEFQSKHNDINGNPLQIDGLPGEKTLWAIIQNSWHNNINS